MAPVVPKFSGTSDLHLGKRVWSLSGWVVVMSQGILPRVYRKTSLIQNPRDQKSFPIEKNLYNSKLKKKNGKISIAPMAMMCGHLSCHHKLAFHMM
jgi:hypothetical protein